MKKTSTLAITGAILLAATGGYLVGKSGNSKEQSPQADEGVGRGLKQARSASSSNESSANAKNRKPRSLAEILAMPDQKARMQALIDLYSNMDAAQLQAEAEKLNRLPMNQRLMASLLLFGRWAEVDPLGALDQTNKMGFGGMMIRPTVMQSWASTDPESAAKYFSENPREFAQMGGPMGGGPGGDNNASVIAAAWAKQDPEAAMKWANSLSSAQDKTAAVASIVREIAAKDPAKAAEVAATLTGEGQTRAYQELAGQWGATDFTAAKAWINTLPAEAREQALASALSSYASTDPTRAAAEVAAMAAGDSRNQAIQSVAQAWASTDPAAAAAWVAKQGEDSNNAIRGVMMNWASQDSSAALSFIQQQPQGDLRDEAVSSYVMSNRTANPQDSIQLAETISDEGDRGRTVGMAAMRWMQEDPAAAKEYIQNSTSISDGAKERILSGRGPFGGRGPR